MLKKFFLLGVLGLVMLGKTTNINTKDYIISKKSIIIRGNNFITLDEKEENNNVEYS